MTMKKKDRYELDKICAYCERATTLAGGEHVLCEKKGVVTEGYHCRKFIYDPTKRIPKRSKPLPEEELEAIDDTVPAKETEEKDSTPVENDTETEDEAFTEVLPQLQLPDPDEIP